MPVLLCLQQDHIIGEGDISPEVLEDLALYEMWEEAEKDKVYQAVEKVLADKVLSISKHPVKEYQSNMEMLLLMEKMRRLPG